MRTVILGGSGFMGRHLAIHLCRAGHQVTTVSRSPLQQLAPGHSHRDITLDDRVALLPLLQNADYLFHLASDTTPGSSRMQPGLEVGNNLLPLAHLLESLQETEAPIFVYISSGGAVYDGTRGGSPFPEESLTSPPSYYGAGKLAAEAFIDAYRQQTGRTAIIVRPANVYGPGQVIKKQFGIVPTLLHCIASGEPLTIWGDGSAVRDYLYIDDFLEFCGSAMEHSWQEGSLNVFNVGTGKGHSILELCDIAETVSGQSLQRHFEAPRGVDVPAVVLDTSHARDVLQWQSVTDLERGLEETWHWYSQMNP